MDPESGHSDEQGKIEEKKVHKIPWALVNVQQDHKKRQIHGELMMPTRMPRRYKDAWIRPPVMLDLHAADDKIIHGLNIMRDSTSRNILHARLILKGASHKSASRILAWVEPFAGNLKDYLMAKNLGLPDYKDPGLKIVLPTPIMRSALSQSIDGIEDLWISGNYHGNFSLAGTYYVIEEKSSACQIKLCNFRKKEGGTYNKYLAEDWSAVLAELKQILAIAETQRSKYPKLNCCQLEGLINVMGGNINMNNAAQAFGAIKRQPFFWGKEERKSFFIYDVPLALSKPDFFLKVENEELIVLPWNETDFHGLLPSMNKYRLNNGQEEYNTKSRTGLVKFVSGLYTHEHQLQPKRNVDVVIKEECPDLCYILYALMPHANRLII